MYDGIAAVTIAQDRCPKLPWARLTLHAVSAV